MSNTENLTQKSARLEREVQIAGDSYRELFNQHELIKSQFEVLKSELETANDKLKGTPASTDPDQQAFIISLKSENDSLKQQVTKLENDLVDFAEQATDEIKRLSEQLDGARKDAAQGIQSVTVDGTKYRVIGKKFTVPGKGQFTLEQLLKDEELQQLLVARGSGHLVELEETPAE